MPAGPQGQKRSADAIGVAVSAARIATGEAEDKTTTPKGVAGGRVRAAALSPSKRSVVSKTAAKVRWSVS